MSNLTHDRPTQQKDRRASIDILRGFALLGILIMNIQGFAMVSMAYSNPTAHLDLSGVNWLVWALSHGLADMKFMALFSILFGAGIVLATERRDAAGRPSAGFFYRRNGWLLIFGLLHGYLIWFGDILVTYALAAFVVFWFRRWPLVVQFVCGGILVGLGPAILMGATRLGGEEELTATLKSMAPTAEAIGAEIRAYQGNWVDAFRFRATTTMEVQMTIPFYLFWRASGLMLIGMALYKAGILSAERSPRFYQIMVILGLLVGVPLVIASVVLLTANDWDPLFALIGPGHLLNYIGSLGMAAAYTGLIMLWTLSGLWTQLKHWLAAVGRMAFTNYILQSVLCSLIFYGFGLGLFGQLERWSQVLVVGAIWMLQLWISPLWLRYFRFGPLEWLWRSLTYFRVQPIRK